MVCWSLELQGLHKFCVDECRTALNIPTAHSKSNLTMQIEKPQGKIYSYAVCKRELRVQGSGKFNLLEWNYYRTLLIHDSSRHPDVGCFR